MRTWTNEYGNLWHPTIQGLRAFGARGGARDARQENELRDALWAEAFDDRVGAECLLRLSANRWLGDKTLHAHSERVASLALRLGRRVGLEKAELRTLQSAALLHDCGKLALDPAVLGKSGALDKAEWKQMQQHPYRGTQLLERFPFLHEALPGVRSHHERWDGSGYGEGLRGEAIPLAARIISLCDVFDALTCLRSYREAYSAQAALGLIREGSGAHFDPALCGHFVAMQGGAVH